MPWHFTFLKDRPGITAHIIHMLKDLCISWYFWVVGGGEHSSLVLEAKVSICSAFSVSFAFPSSDLAPALSNSS